MKKIWMKGELEMPRKKGRPSIGHNSYSTKSCSVYHGSADYNQNVVFAPYYPPAFDTAPFGEGPVKEPELLLEKLAEEFVHQVGNPLCALKGFIALAAEHSNDLHLWQQLIHEEMQHLEDILKVYSIIAGRQYESSSVIDLRSVVTQVINRFTPRAIEKGVWVTLPYPAQSLPVLISADKMEIALLNLVDNALEASHSGDIIDLRLQKSNQHAVISITNTVDQSPSQDFLTELLPFYTTKTGHSGLGLWLTDRIIHSYDGQLQIKSRDMLVTATITLPLCR